MISTKLHIKGRLIRVTYNTLKIVHRFLQQVKQAKPVPLLNFETICVFGMSEFW